MAARRLSLFRDKFQALSTVGGDAHLILKPYIVIDYLDISMSFEIWSVS
jgi:hypothetical protein